jgi:hypothetical protein
VKSAKAQNATYWIENCVWEERQIEATSPQEIADHGLLKKALRSELRLGRSISDEELKQILLTVESLRDSVETWLLANHLGLVQQ